MATNYPAGLDTFTNPTSSDTLASPNHADQHANANDAIEAIEATLGVNPHGGAASVSARIAAVEAAAGVMTMIGVAATGDGNIAGTDVAIATTVSFTTDEVKDIGFILPMGITWSVGAEPILTAQLVNDENTVVQSLAISGPPAPSGGLRWSGTIAGVFADAPADTYVVRLMANGQFASGTRVFVSGLVQY